MTSDKINDLTCTDPVCQSISTFDCMTFRLKVGIHRISKRTSIISCKSIMLCRQRDLLAVRKLDASTRFTEAQGILIVSGLSRPGSLPPRGGPGRSQRATTTNPLLPLPHSTPASDLDRILLSSFRQINNRSLPSATASSCRCYHPVSSQPHLRFGNSTHLRSILVPGAIADRRGNQVAHQQEYKRIN